MTSARLARLLPVALLGLLLGSSPGICGAKKSSHKGSTEDPLQLYNLGTEYLRQGRPDRAAPLLERAVAGQPDSPIIAYVLGLSYYGIRDLDKAEKVFLRLLDMDPFFTDAHNSLGIVYADRGDWVKARAHFERVLADKRYLTPEVARFNIGRILVLQGQAAEALPHLQAAVSAKPDNVSYRSQYAIALESLERFEEARKELETVVQTHGDDAEAQYHLGVVCFHLEDKARARECFRRVVVLSPTSEMGVQASEYLRQLGS